MEYFNANSKAEERALASAWEDLRQAFVTSTVRVTVQHRVTASVRDAITFLSMLRELQVAELGAAEATFRATSGKVPQEVFEYLGEHGDHGTFVMYRYAAGMKAMYYFIRALQDATYAVLVESTGGRAGEYSSMSDGTKKPSSPVRKLLDARLPAYLPWFARHRELRNRMKFGVPTGSSYSPAEHGVQVAIHEVTDNPPLSDIRCYLSIDDVDEAFRQSANLLQLAAERVRAGVKPKGPAGETE